jgi:hypothetical protein
MGIRCLCVFMPAADIETYRGKSHREWNICNVLNHVLHRDLVSSAKSIT